MKLAFAFVAVMVAVVCTQDEFFGSAAAAPSHHQPAVPQRSKKSAKSHSHSHKSSSQHRAEERRAALSQNVDLDKLMERFEELESVEYLPGAEGGRRSLRRRQMMMSSDSMSMSSGDSMSMSMSSSDAAAGGAASRAAGVPLMGQMQDPELMLTGEMLRRLEEQTLGFSYSAASPVAMATSFNSLSSLWWLLSAILTYLLFL